jgi:hypothetical protein
VRTLPTAGQGVVELGKELVHLRCRPFTIRDPLGCLNHSPAHENIVIKAVPQGTAERARSQQCLAG